jgi:hypothetical protein
MEPQVALIDRDIWPDSRHQLLLVDDFAGAFDQNDKNVERASTQVNRAARLLEVSVRWAQAKWTERNRVRSRRGLFVSHLNSLETTGTGNNRGLHRGFQWNDRCHVKAWLRSESPDSGTADCSAWLPLRRAAIFGGRPAVAFATEARVRTCAVLFLPGCEVQGIQGLLQLLVGGLPDLRRAWCSGVIGS